MVNLETVETAGEKLSGRRAENSLKLIENFKKGVFESADSDDALRTRLGAIFQRKKLNVNSPNIPEGCYLNFNGKRITVGYLETEHIEPPLIKKGGVNGRAVVDRTIITRELSILLQNGPEIHLSSTVGEFKEKSKKGIKEGSTFVDGSATFFETSGHGEKDNDRAYETIGAFFEKELAILLEQE